MAKDEVRDAAVYLLLRVFEQGAYIDAALDRTLKRRRISERGRKFLTQLVYGTVRHALLADHILIPLLRQPIEDLPRPIHAILRMGVFQALFINQTPFPVMVHTSVDLAKRHGHAGTAKLVNAVLKRVPQSLDALELPPGDTPEFASVRYSMPRWLVERWWEDVGADRALALCRAMNEPAPVTLRTNTLRIAPGELAEGLTKAGYPAESQTLVPEEITMAGGAPPVRAKLFRHGFCTVQDPAAMLGAHLLQPEAGQRVLDLCAAPGGKTTHAAERAGGDAAVAACDTHFNKLRRLQDHAGRLETPGVSVFCADGRQPPWRDGSFDRVLVDAPCSGLGTLRRRPDLKLRVRPESAAKLAELQTDLLRRAIALCKNGGLVVYGVCTLGPTETSDVVSRAVVGTPATPEDGPPWMEPWRTDTGTYETNPASDCLDGFFWTRLRVSS